MWCRIIAGKKVGVKKYENFQQMIQKGKLKRFKVLFLQFLYFIQLNIVDIILNTWRRELASINELKENIINTICLTHQTMRTGHPAPQLQDQNLQV
jgi:hypothetical protein